jgi:hypothetical protein
MPVRREPRLVVVRRNRFLGWGLGFIALLLYGAMRWRWTQGF